MGLIPKDLSYRVVPPSLRRHVLSRFTPEKSPFLAEMYARRVIFVHVPKAAGTSLQIELYGRSDGGHRRIAAFAAADPEATASFVKCAFVRNPWDRLLSAYSFLTQGVGANYTDRQFARRTLGQTPTFESFVLRLADPGFHHRAKQQAHLRPQAFWICMPGETEHAMDFLGRFETMPADLARLRATLDLPTPTRAPTSAKWAVAPAGEDGVTRARPSTHVPYQDAYTSTMRDIVGEVYARDVDLLGYTFDA